MLLIDAAPLDLDGFRQNLARQGTPQRVFHFEHGIMPAIKAELMRRLGINGRGSKAPADQWKAEADLYRRLGMELFRVFPPGGTFDIPALSGSGWAQEHAGPIQSAADVERYAWPDPAAIDFSQLEWSRPSPAPGHGVFVKVSLLEIVTGLFGFETLCFKLFDEPELVQEVIGRVGRFHTALAKSPCGFRCVFALYGSDDFGFRTSTLLPPQTIREYFLPWHRAWAQMAHHSGRFYFLHSCGQLQAIMDDIIYGVQVDAKHSFEDAILPVDQAKIRYGHRLSLLGGLDVDRIARSDEATIRRYTRRILDRCVPGGGYFLGLGNWVTEYIPPENYLAVLDEARRYAS